MPRLPRHLPSLLSLPVVSALRARLRPSGSGGSGGGAPKFDVRLPEWVRHRLCAPVSEHTPSVYPRVETAIWETVRSYQGGVVDSLDPLARLRLIDAAVEAVARYARRTADPLDERVRDAARSVPSVVGHYARVEGVGDERVRAALRGAVAVGWVRVG